MAIFRYRMQNILNLKENLENQEKQNFALMRLKLNEEEEKLAAEKERRLILENEAKQMRKGPVNILKIKENEAQLKYQDEMIKAQVLRVRIAEKNLDAARLKMQRAIQEREIHEKLKERAFEEFLEEEKQNEAKEIDQLTSYTYGKNSKEKQNG